jgi:hypothetical protein
VGLAGDDDCPGFSDGVERVGHDLLGDLADSDQGLIGELTPGELIDRGPRFLGISEDMRGAELERLVTLERDRIDDLLVVGLVLLLLGSVGHGIGGRRWYF